MDLWGGAFVQAVVVEPNVDRWTRARPMAQGTARAKIAVVLERLGSANEAHEQLDQATKLGGHDPGWWRQLGEKAVAVAASAGLRRPSGGRVP